MTPNADSADWARFEAIWSEHRLRILAYCLRRMSPDDAEDACAETFLVAWRRIEMIPADHEALLFLYGIARRVVANQHRTLRRRTRLDVKLLALAIPYVEDVSLLVVQGAQDEIVAASVRRLDRRDSEIVMLHAWEELPHADIAAILGMTVAAVDQRIHRAYRRLGRMLEATLDLKTLNSPPIAEGGGT